MQCERLIKLTKTWYLNVRDETMAPARMVSFIEQHVANCSVCQQDPDIHDEIARITEIVLPESKIPKAVRASQNDEEEVDEEDYEEDDSDNTEDDEDEELDEDLDEEIDDEELDDEMDEDIDNNEDEDSDDF